VEIPGSVDMIEARSNLAKNVTYETTRKGTTLTSLDEVKKIAFHGLEDKIKLPGIGEKEKVIERNNIRVERNCAK